jgi:hypothetical protein
MATLVIILALMDGGNQGLFAADGKWTDGTDDYV